MIYPIVTYGDPILRQRAVPIAEGTPLQALVRDLFATMEQAQGIGLAAPQIGQSILLFVVDVTQHPTVTAHKKTHKKAFINPVIEVDETVVPTLCEEGCLSIPNVLVTVPRREKIKISYFDAQWKAHQEVCAGFLARVLQHEYDHLEGKLHIDYASPLKRRLLKNKLIAIRKEQPGVPYERSTLLSTL